MVKSPFVTNRQYYHRYPTSAEDVMRCISGQVRDMYEATSKYYYGPIVPYLILQERVEDNAEAKVVFILYY